VTQLIDLSNAARVYSRMSAVRSNLISNSDILILANSILEECRNKMVEIESNLVYSTGTVTTVASTPSYELPFSHTGFIEGGVSVSGESPPLREVLEEDKVKYGVADGITGPPTAFYLPASGLFYPLPVPDAAYTIDIFYWLPLTKLTAVSGGGADLPTTWYNIWDRYVTKRLEYEFRTIFERDTSSVAMELVGIEAEAIMAVYRRGVRKRRSRSDFFSVEGV